MLSVMLKPQAQGDDLTAAKPESEPRGILRKVGDTEVGNIGPQQRYDLRTSEGKPVGHEEYRS